MPHRTRVVKSFLDSLFEARKSCVYSTNPGLQIINGTANVRLKILNSCEDFIPIGC